MNAHITQQVETCMDGTEYGDPSLREFMRAELEKRLMQVEKEQRPLRVYCGYDVTGPDLHLGHTVTLRKLRQFQDFGHVVYVVIGTFTSLIGDPSDRETAREKRGGDTIMQESISYARQAFKVLDETKTGLLFNHEWLQEISIAEILNIGSIFSLQQLLGRDNLKKRMLRNDVIQFQEILYPIAQAYDAVKIQADVQIGATEQLFNLMAGRKLQEHFHMQPQICLTMPILVGIDGKKRMSKSTGNYIGIMEAPIEKFKKLMKIPTGALPSYIHLLTRWTVAEKDRMVLAISTSKTDTKKLLELKKSIAWEIVAGIDGETEANKAMRTVAL